MTTGEKVTAHRKIRGLTGAELARRANCSRSYIWQIEQGEVDPTIRKLITIAQALRVHPADLLPDVTIDEE